MLVKTFVRLKASLQAFRNHFLIYPKLQQGPQRRTHPRSKQIRDATTLPGQPQDSYHNRRFTQDTPKTSRRCYQDLADPQTYLRTSRGLMSLWVHGENDRKACGRMCTSCAPRFPVTAYLPKLALPWLPEVAARSGCPKWLSEVAARSGCPRWFPELVVRSGCLK